MAEENAKDKVKEDKHSQKRNPWKSRRSRQNNKEAGTKQDGSTWTTCNHVTCRNNGTDGYGAWTFTKKEPNQEWKVVVYKDKKKKEEERTIG